MTKLSGIEPDPPPVPEFDWSAVDQDLQDYRNALSGDGPHAYTWTDKPHRLVYDLLKMVHEMRVRQKAVGEGLLKLAKQ